MSVDRGGLFQELGTKVMSRTARTKAAQRAHAAADTVNTHVLLNRSLLPSGFVFDESTRRHTIRGSMPYKPTGKPAGRPRFANTRSVLGSARFFAKEIAFVKQAAKRSGITFSAALRTAALEWAERINQKSLR